MPKQSNSTRLDPADERQYVVSAMDHNGRSTMVSTHVMPAVAREIEIQVSRGKFPFKTKGDLLRWCIWYGMKTLEERKGAGGFLMWAEAEMVSMRDEMYKHTMLQHAGLLEKLVEEHLKDGSNGGKLQAMGLVQHAIDSLSKIPQGAWRNKALKEMKKRFERVIKMVPPRVSLDPESYDDESEENGEE